VAASQETAAGKYLEKLMKEHGEEEGAEGPEGHEGDEWEGEGGPAGGMAEGGGLEGRDEEGQMPPNEVEHPDGDEHSYGAFDSEFDNNNAGAEAERGEIGSDYASDDTVGAAHRAEGYTGSGVEFNHEYAAGAGAPSGSNTYTPSGTGIKRGVKKQRHEVEFYNRRTNGRQVDPVRLQRDQLRLKLARIEAQNKERDQVIRDLQVKYRRAEREKDLVHLDAQGYQFDLAEELSAVARLSGKDYKAYLDRIRKRYSRAPINAVYHRPADAPAGRGSMSQRSRQEAMAIAEYAAEHDISYSDAADKMRSGAEKVL